MGFGILLFIMTTIHRTWANPGGEQFITNSSTLELRLNALYNELYQEHSAIQKRIQDKLKYAKDAKTLVCKAFSDDIRMKIALCVENLKSSAPKSLTQADIKECMRQHEIHYLTASTEIESKIYEKIQNRLYSFRPLEELERMENDFQTSLRKLKVTLKQCLKNNVSLANPNICIDAIEHQLRLYKNIITDFSSTTNVFIGKISSPEEITRDLNILDVNENGNPVTCDELLFEAFTLSALGTKTCFRFKVMSQQPEFQ